MSWIAADLQAVLDRLTPEQIGLATLYGEARSEPIEGVVAVANVFKHRRKDGRWGGDYRSVCLATWQFSCWHEKGGKRNHERVVALARTLAGGAVTDSRVRELTYLWHGVLREGWIQDNVKGATHYHVASMQPRPVWAQGRTPVCQKGNHAFYSGIA